MQQPLDLSPNGLALIKQHEGVRLQAYLCPANKLTIGYGHVLLPRWDNGLFNRLSSDELSRIIDNCQSRRALTHEAKVVLNIKQAQADELLLKDVRQTVLFLNSILSGLNQNQFDAVVSFVFNVGQGNFATSTLRKKLLAGLFDACGVEFDKWIYTTQHGKKIKLPGLITRRAAERALFETPL